MRREKTCACCAAIEAFALEQFARPPVTDNTAEEDLWADALNATVCEACADHEKGKCSNRVPLTAGLLKNRQHSREIDGRKARAAAKRGSGTANHPLVPGDGNPGEVGESTITGAAPNPLEVILQREDHARVKQLLSSLSPLDEQTLTLNAYGFSAPEIAARQGRTPGSVRTTMCRARRRLAAQAASEREPW